MRKERLIFMLLLVFLVSMAARAAMAQSCINAPASTYNFWPGEGDGEDLVGDRPGTLANDATFMSGVQGQAFQFDGVDDWLHITPNYKLDVTNTFTIAFWVNTNQTHQIDSQSSGGISGTSGQKYALWPTWFDQGHAGAGVSVGTNGVSVYEHAASYMPATLVWQGGVSGWTHVAVVYNNRLPSLYINGVLVKTGVIGGKPYVHPGNVFGWGSYGSLQGGLDEIAIFNQALSAQEIQTLAANGICHPVQVPTLSEWALISLIGGLAFLGFYSIKRRKPALA